MKRYETNEEWVQRRKNEFFEEKEKHGNTRYLRTIERDIRDYYKERKH